MTEYKILKLLSGEEIICDVISKEHPRTFEISTPLRISVVPKVTEYGVDEAISLVRWIHFSEENVYNLDKSKVMVITQASTGLSKFYEYCVKKIAYEGDIQEREPSNKELQGIEEEEWDEEFGEVMTKTLH